MVYRGLLCYHSTYFDRMLNGEFAEAAQDPLRLSHVNLTAFRTFFYWTNTGLVNFYHSDGTMSATLRPMRAVEAYILADYHGVLRLKNALLDYLFSEFTTNERILSRAVCRHLYDNTVDGDAFRRMLLDVCVTNRNLKMFKKELLDDYHKEFLLNYILVLNKNGIIPGVGPSDLEAWMMDMRTNFCARYHDHSTPEAPHGARRRVILTHLAQGSTVH